MKGYVKISIQQISRLIARIGVDKSFTSESRLKFGVSSGDESLYYFVTNVTICGEPYAAILSPFCTNTAMLFFDDKDDPGKIEERLSYYLESQEYPENRLCFDSMLFVEKEEIVTMSKRYPELTLEIYS